MLRTASGVSATRGLHRQTTPIMEGVSPTLTLVVVYSMLITLGKWLIDTCTIEVNMVLITLCLTFIG